MPGQACTQPLQAGNPPDRRIRRKSLSPAAVEGIIPLGALGIERDGRRALEHFALDLPDLEAAKWRRVIPLSTTSRHFFALYQENFGAQEGSVQDFTMKSST